jgi:hypothetical protein
MSSYDHLCFLQRIQHICSSASLSQLERGPPFGRGLAARCARKDVLFLYAEPSNYRDAPAAHRPGPRAVTLVPQS